MTKRKILYYLATILSLCASWFVLSCRNDEPAQVEYPFEAEYVIEKHRIFGGEYLKISGELRTEEASARDYYTVRYKQLDGEGALRLVGKGNPMMKQNEAVSLNGQNFSLYYFSLTGRPFTFELTFEGKKGEIRSYKIENEMAPPHNPIPDSPIDPDSFSVSLVADKKAISSYKEEKVFFTAYDNKWQDITSDVTLYLIGDDGSKEELTDKYFSSQKCRTYRFQATAPNKDLLETNPEAVNDEESASSEKESISVSNIVDVDITPNGTEIEGDMILLPNKMEIAADGKDAVLFSVLNREGVDITEQTYLEQDGNRYEGFRFTSTIPATSNFNSVKGAEKSAIIPITVGEKNDPKPEDKDNKKLLITLVEAPIQQMGKGDKAILHGALADNNPLAKRWQLAAQTVSPKDQAATLSLLQDNTSKNLSQDWTDLKEGKFDIECLSNTNLDQQLEFKFRSLDNNNDQLELITIPIKFEGKPVKPDIVDISPSVNPGEISSDTGNIINIDPKGNLFTMTFTQKAGSGILRMKGLGTDIKYDQAIRLSKEPYALEYIPNANSYGYHKVTVLIEANGLKKEAVIIDYYRPKKIDPKTITLPSIETPIEIVGIGKEGNMGNIDLSNIDAKTLASYKLRFLQKKGKGEVYLNETKCEYEKNYSLTHTKIKLSYKPLEVGMHEVALILTDAYGNTQNGLYKIKIYPKVTGITLEASENSIKSDGKDVVTFVVKDSNGKDLTNKSTITINDQAVTNARFSTTKVGTYNAVAKFGSFVSNVVKIEAVAVVEPKDVNVNSSIKAGTTSPSSLVLIGVDTKGESFKMTFTQEAGTGKITRKGQAPYSYNQSLDTPTDPFQLEYTPESYGAHKVSMTIEGNGKSNKFVIVDFIRPKKLGESNITIPSVEEPDNTVGTDSSIDLGNVTIDENDSSTLKTYKIVFTQVKGEGEIYMNGTKRNFGEYIPIEKPKVQLSYIPKSLGAHEVKIAVTDAYGSKRESVYRTFVSSKVTEVRFTAEKSAIKFGDNAQLNAVVAKDDYQVRSVQVQFKQLQGKGDLFIGTSKINTDQYFSPVGHSFNLTYKPKSLGKHEIQLLAKYNGETFKDNVILDVTTSGSITFSPLAKTTISMNEITSGSVRIDYPEPLIEDFAITLVEGMGGIKLSNGKTLEVGKSTAATNQNISFTYAPRNYGENRFKLRVENPNIKGSKTEKEYVFTSVPAPSEDSFQISLSPSTIEDGEETSLKLSYTTEAMRLFHVKFTSDSFADNEIKITAKDGQPRALNTDHDATDLSNDAKSILLKVKPSTKLPYLKKGNLKIHLKNQLGAQITKSVELHVKPTFASGAVQTPSSLVESTFGKKNTFSIKLAPDNAKNDYLELLKKDIRITFSLVKGRGEIWHKNQNAGYNNALIPQEFTPSFDFIPLSQGESKISVAISYKGRVMVQKVISFRANQAGEVELESSSEAYCRLEERTTRTISINYPKELVDRGDFKATFSYKSDLGKLRIGEKTIHSGEKVSLDKKITQWTFEASKLTSSPVNVTVAVQNDILGVNESKSYQWKIIPSLKAEKIVPKYASSFEGDKFVFEGNPIKLSFDVLTNNTEEKALGMSYYSVKANANGSSFGSFGFESSDKTLTYTPKNLGTHRFSFIVTDRLGKSISKELTIDVKKGFTPSEVVFETQETNVGLNENVPFEFVLAEERNDDPAVIEELFKHYSITVNLKKGKGMHSHIEGYGPKLPFPIKVYNHRLSRHDFNYIPTTQGEHILELTVMDSKKNTIKYKKEVHLIVSQYDSFDIEPVGKTEEEKKCVVYSAKGFKASFRLFVKDPDPNISYHVRPVFLDASGNIDNSAGVAFYNKPIERGITSRLTQGDEAQENGISLRDRNGRLPSVFNVYYQPRKVGYQRLGYIITSSKGSTKRVIYNVKVFAPQIKYTTQRMPKGFNPNYLKPEPSFSTSYFLSQDQSAYHTHNLGRIEAFLRSPIPNDEYDIEAPNSKLSLSYRIEGGSPLAYTFEEPINPDEELVSFKGGNGYIGRVYYEGVKIKAKNRGENRIVFTTYSSYGSSEYPVIMHINDPKTYKVETLDDGKKNQSLIISRTNEIPDSFEIKLLSVKVLAHYTDVKKESLSTTGCYVLLNNQRLDKGKSISITPSKYGITLIDDTNIFRNLPKCLTKITREYKLEVKNTYGIRQIISLIHEEQNPNFNLPSCVPPSTNWENDGIVEIFQNYSI